MRFELQINALDFAGLDVPKGLFVVYADASGAHAHHAVRYYSHPSHVHFQSGRDSEPTELLEEESRADFLPPTSLIDLLGRAELAKLEALHPDRSGARSYLAILSGGGYDGILFENHVGGWHMTHEGRRYMPPRCDQCQADLVLVAQLELGDFTRSLWCCARHPPTCHYAVHK